MSAKLCSRLVLPIVLLLLPALLFGADPVVLRVVVIQTDNPDAYVKEVDRSRAILKRLESPAQIRVWRARFAGDRAGTIVAAIEYPNMAAFARDDARLAADSEFQAWLKNLDKVRKIVSDSLYMELKP